MTKAEKPAPPAMQGRFEISAEKFYELTKDRASSVQNLDMREALPDLFVGSDRIPRLVEKVWRRACDEVIAENRGVYAHKSGTVAQVFFYELTDAVARAKVAQIRGKMPVLLRAAQGGDESVFSAPLPDAARTVAAAQKEGGGQDLARLAKEGLPDNPSLEIVQLWAARVLQDMITGSQKMPLTREMIEIAARSDIAYLPLWSASNAAVVGSLGALQRPLPAAQQNTGEPLRQDLALFFSACFQAYAMQSKGVAGLVVAPVRASTLLDKGAGELYVGLARRFPPPVLRNLSVEVRDVPKGTSPGSLIGVVDALGQLVRACIFETGILSYADFKKSFPKLHACGFDSMESHIGEHEQVRLMNKYADHYHGTGVRTYVKNVSSPYVLDAAVKYDITYISGPVVAAAQKSFFTTQKKFIEDFRPGTP